MPARNDTLTQLAGRIAALERLVQQLSRTSRLGQSSIEDGAIQVYDTDGQLRGSIGLQDDGTVAVAAVNGPTPPAPSTPTIASVLGGVAVTWDGTFLDGSTAPADFAYTEVHFAAAEDFADGGVLYSAFYAPAGATMTVPCDVPVWVRLVCASTSSVTSPPSPVAGPAGPSPVVAQEVLDGIVSDLALADGAVTAAKLAAASVGPTTIQDGAVQTQHMTAGTIDGGVVTAGTLQGDALVAKSITGGKIKALEITGDKIAVNTLTADKLAAGTITAASGVISSIDASKITVGKIVASQIDATNLVISGSSVSGAVSSATSAASATAVTGSIGAGVTVPAGQLSAAQIPASTTINGSSIITGTVDATKLLVSGVASNLVVDPGFETAVGAALVAAAGSNWSLDTVVFSGGNRSVKFSATSAAATTSDLPVLKGVPVTAGDQVYFAADWSATTLVGSATVAQKFYIGWKNAAGTILSYSVLTAPATLDGMWRTVSGTATAPAGAVTFDAVLQAFQYTSATLWWDNLIVRPILGSTQIQSGAIQTTHLSATAIDGKVITGATLRTGATGQRIEIVPQGPIGILNTDNQTAYPAAVAWYSGLTGEATPGAILLYNADGEFGLQPTFQLATADLGYGSGSLQLIAGNSGGDNAGLLVNVADQTLMVSKLSGLVVGDSDSLYLRADGSNNVYFGTVSIGLVQDWTTVALASGFTANGNSQGTPQYRVIDWLGTRFVQWRGGVALTYTSNVIANTGAMLSTAVPAVARPSTLRTCPGACGQTSNGFSLALKLDFTASGGVNVVGTASTYNPAWVSLNGVMYSL